MFGNTELIRENHTFDFPQSVIPRLSVFLRILDSNSVFPDGRRIASCSDNHISIWSLRHVGAMEEVERTSDELVLKVKAQFMVFASGGQRALLLPSLRVLDTTTLEEKAALGFTGSHYSWGALSASGSKVATATPVIRTRESEILVWDLTLPGDSTDNHRTLQGHTDFIYSVSFSHNERQLVSASNDGTARVWGVATGIQIHVLKHPDTVYHASFSHSNTRIVSSSQHTAHIWDAQLGQELRRFDIETRSVTFTPDDKHIIASFESTTAILNTESHKLEHQYKGYRYWTTLEDGASYMLDDDGWVYRAARLDDQPRRLAWIPSPYRPSLYDAQPNATLSGPLFTSSSQGIQLCLPREDGLVTLLIPYDYLLV